MAWPGSLPQAFTIGSYQSTRPSTVIRSQPEAGPAIIRRRFSRGVTLFSGDMVMTRAQRDEFVEFFDTTTDGGALEFNFPAQDGSDDLWRCRFTGEPTERWLSASHWQVSMQMERLPGVVVIPGSGIGTMTIGTTFTVA